SIGNYAFRYCDSLTSVVIGDSVTSIGDDAFYNCPSLTSVYYKGTSSEWSSISKGSNNSELTYYATRYYYIENEADVPTGGGNYWHYVDGVPTKW
ncbi:MAG: leucine-rich repeat protein, partial [Clostridia bacterium]|nr:leucine-rich repeat protein [Clostridia bacterium]